MTTTINASTSSGAVITSDTSGVLQLQTGGTTAVTIGTDQSVNFPVTGQRITGDFSNATAANRVAFQSSTSNSQTAVLAIPNGTSTTAQWQAYNNSDSNNASFLGLAAVGATDARLTSGITGTGTYLPMTFFTGGTESLRLSATTKAVILAGGSTSANGTGITFPATQSASTDANTLDDYEEGTWTPSMSFGGVGVTTTGSNCIYTRIGRQVSITGTFNVTRGAQAGNAGISGFPFAIPVGTFPFAAYWSGLGISGQEAMVFNNAGDVYWVGRTGISNVNSSNTPTTIFSLVVNVIFNL